MSLTGDLQIFPLEEVLRLLARTKRNGCLRVDAAGLQGRIFIEGGSLSLATSVSDEDLRRQLLNAGLVEEDDFRRVELGEAALPDVLAPGMSAAALTDFVREHCVESLFRIRRPGTGSFEFAVDVRPRYPTGQSLDAEVALSEADRRATEWADIEQAVTDLNAPIRLVRELPDENNVTISPPTWRVLAALEAGSSVVQVADTLGLSEFRAAREIASLMRSQLVEYRQAPSAAWPAEATRDVGGWDQPQTPTWQEQPAPEPAQADTWQTEPEAGTETEPTPVAGEVPDHQASGDRGWWTEAMSEEQEPEAEPGAANGTEPDPEPTEPAPAAESDDDGFLESVFSQLDPDAEHGDEDEDDETGFSMGLLRRRRMGAAARDLSDPDA